MYMLPNTPDPKLVCALKLCGWAQNQGVVLTAPLGRKYIVETMEGEMVKPPSPQGWRNMHYLAPGPI